MQPEYFGLGSIEHLRTVLKKESPQHIFLIHGKSSYSLSGAQLELTPLLQPYHFISFTDFSPNAKEEDIEKGLDLFKEHHCDLIIAVGGGSALDLGKAIAFFADYPGKLKSYFEEKVSLPNRRIPFVAIPTTAGTGSEATHFAAIYRNKTKYSLAHPSLVPDYAIIDPRFTFSLPPYVTACTGMDALSQAVESYWSVHSTAESRAYAGEAITLILHHLERAVCSPTPDARVAMAKAANLAGKAINISFTTACHSISYPITSYFNIPHGQAVALTLPEMVVYNGGITDKDCTDARGVSYVKSIMDDLCSLFQVSSPGEMKVRIEQIMDTIGLERRLNALNIQSLDDVELIIQNGFNPERVKNNPRLLTEEKLRKMLHNIC